MHYFKIAYALPPTQGDSSMSANKLHDFLDGVFPYLAQMIVSMRWCVARPKAKVTQVIRIFAVGLEVSQ